jgi:hypothetical protein
MIKILTIAGFLFYSSCYGQSDTTNYKLDLDSYKDFVPPNFIPNNRDYVHKGPVNYLSPDSTLVLVDDKLYRTVEIDMLSDNEVNDLSNNLESIHVTTSKTVVDSILVLPSSKARIDSTLAARIKTIIIIRHKQ